MGFVFRFLLIALQVAGALALVLDIVIAVMVMRGYELHARYIKEDEDEQ